MAQSELAFDTAAAHGHGISGRQAVGRAIALAAFALAQAVLVSFFYDPPYRDDAPNAVVGFLRQYSTVAVHGLILVAATYLVINWPQRQDVLASWRKSIDDRRVAPWVALNAVALLIVLAASAYISQSIEHYAQYLAPYLVLLALLGCAFLLTVAPLRFWRALLAETWLSLLLALLIAAFVLLFSRVAQAGWEPLAGATLELSHWLLSLYETGVFVNFATRELGVGDFIVNIAPQCSGYEGIGLVAAFLTLYLIVFRRDLAFPNALFLLPAGIITIWLLNAVRIAVLVSLGAHVSPQLAIGGFHSQAGWIAFLLVTVGLMAISHTVPFFKRTRREAVTAAGLLPAVPAATTGAKDDALPWLAPFIALMAASIIAGAFVPYDRWLYGLRVLGIGFAVWVFWGFYWDRLKDKVDVVAILAGLAVGLAWIATDPDIDAGRDLGDWLMTLSPLAVAVWLIIRGAGTIVLVPIAEEFAFRGYLHSFIKDRVLFSAGPVAMTVMACIVSSALFGAIHQRWLAGALAGVVFALVMYRTGRISSAVVAHMAANAAIFAWALAFRQWSLI